MFIYGPKLILRGDSGLTLYETTRKRFEIRLDHVMVGEIGIEYLERWHGRVYVRIEEGFRNKGLASRALRMLESWVFTVEKYRLLSARAATDDLWGQRILQHAGYKETTRSHHIVYFHKFRPD